MTATMAIVLAITCLWIGAVAGASDEKIIPVSVSVSENGFGSYSPQRPPPQPQIVYQPAPQPVYQPSYGGGPAYNQVNPPPNYGNQPGPGENAIAPNVNPYPRQSYCITTGESTSNK